ncbi:hypothetical protein M514_04124 [Trichuris suis]|uniref:Uncharacterized protein n=1 Tax=Trichuris suis TaxID=68888 RepID=A0A085NG23_9BILA|nr:hypothetical protein M513_04124 [Trichuris suis]KFD68419.1 hypothetical protein M514_04124 [Trichuris suis]
MSCSNNTLKPGLRRWSSDSELLRYKSSDRSDGFEELEVVTSSYSLMDPAMLEWYQKKMDSGEPWPPYRSLFKMKSPPKKKKRPNSGSVTR